MLAEILDVRRENSTEQCKDANKIKVTQAAALLGLKRETKEVRPLVSRGDPGERVPRNAVVKQA